METGALLFFCGFEMFVFMCGWFARSMWMGRQRILQIRGIQFKYADGGEDYYEEDERGRYAPPPAYNPHAERKVRAQ